MKIIIICSLFILSLFCPNKGGKSNVVNVYTLPFEESYYLSIDSKEKIKQHANVKLEKIKNKIFIKELNKFFSTLDETKFIRDYKTIDIRVLLEYKKNENSTNELALNSFGNFLWNGKVYQKNDTLLAMVSKYTKIKW
jgi:hypothetical protein